MSVKDSPQTNVEAPTAVEALLNALVVAERSLRSRRPCVGPGCRMTSGRVNESVCKRCTDVRLVRKVLMDVKALCVELAL